MKSKEKDTSNPNPNYVPPALPKQKPLEFSIRLVDLGLCQPGQEKEFCKQSKMGEYKCYVYIDSSYDFCDACLRDELMYLKLQGVKTSASCCGHGDKNKASIIVDSKKSIKKMYELGYKKKLWEHENSTQAMYEPKTRMMYEE